MTHLRLPVDVQRGIALINRGEYFEAHEVLEAAWRAEPGPIRELYRGLLQAAVAAYHLERGNWRGAWKVAGRALRHLTPWPEVVLGIDVAALRRDVAALRTLAQRAMEGEIPEAVPKLKVVMKREG